MAAEGIGSENAAPREALGTLEETVPWAVPMLSVCIPAYNRARFLHPLLRSISEQESDPGAAIEIVISEDASAERCLIAAIAQDAASKCRWPIRYYENEANLGYDANVRRLIELARGEYCLFMGNDDLLAPGALRTLLRALADHPDTGLVLRGYACFDERNAEPYGEVRYVSRPTVLTSGREAVSICFRRSGVISGYVVARQPALEAATDRFDGGLYYQLHLTAAVLQQRPALILPDVLVLCRAGIPPDFGGAESERDHFVPGHYTPEARTRMLKGALEILDAHPELRQDGTRSAILKDYARHFYPFVMDQLDLPPSKYLRMCRAMAKTPVGRFPSFYLNCALAYLLGRERCDAVIQWLRSRFGRTLRLS